MGARKRRHPGETFALTVAALLVLAGAALLAAWWYTGQPSYRVSHTVPTHRWIGPAIAPHYPATWRNT